MASDLPTGIGDQRQRPRSVVHAFLEMLTHGPSYGGLQEIGMLTLIEEPVGDWKCQLEELLFLMHWPQLWKASTSSTTSAP